MGCRTMEDVMSVFNAYLGVSAADQKIVGPLGIADVFVAGTLMSQRRSNEALAEDPGLNVTALDPNSNQLLPAAYGGFMLETMDSGGGLIASTPSLVQLVHHYAA
jgi:hypothetical protein